ncbi:MAG: hypothetical protein KIS94_16095 [Chitinophagales bacterium]|nr:hypothetical protein [Chitinophagales bacterium]
MKRRITPFNFPNNFNAVLTAIFIAVFAVGASAQQSSNDRSGNTVVIPNTIPPDNVPAASSSATQFNAAAYTTTINGKKFFDNGYIKFELTGDPAKDEEAYKREKEKLFANTPELYNEWLRGKPFATPKKTTEPPSK